MAESHEMLLDVKLDLKDVKNDNCLKVRFFVNFFFFCKMFKSSSIVINLKKIHEENLVYCAVVVFLYQKFRIASIFWFHFYFSVRVELGELDEMPR